jgi:hypothetical protein
LQNLRRSVFDMYKEEVNRSSNGSSPESQNSDRGPSSVSGINYSSTSQSTNHEYSTTNQTNTILFTPGSVSNQGSSGNPSQYSHQGGLVHDRMNTPYHNPNVPREYSEGNFAHFGSMNYVSSGAPSPIGPIPVGSHFVHGPGGVSSGGVGSGGGGGGGAHQPQQGSPMSAAGSLQYSNQSSPTRRAFGSTMGFVAEGGEGEEDSRSNSNGTSSNNSVEEENRKFDQKDSFKYDNGSDEEEEDDDEEEEEVDVIYRRGDSENGSEEFQLKLKLTEGGGRVGKGAVSASSPSSRDKRTASSSTYGKSSGTSTAAAVSPEHKKPAAPKRSSASASSKSISVAQEEPAVTSKGKSSKNKAKKGGPNSAVAQVGHSISVILGQHEERFSK